MDFLRNLFKKKQPKASPSPASSSGESTKPTPAKEASLSNQEDVVKKYKSLILKRASSHGIPQETVETNLKNLSSEEFRLLAECADGLFVVYLWSPPGTEAKAQAKRSIGLRS